MSNNFTGDITLRTPRPRSRRLRETGGTGGSVSASSQSSAVPDHNQLFGRDSDNAHPVNAITGLSDFMAVVNEMFELEGAGTSASPYVIKAKHDLYSIGGITAYGQGSGGGGGGVSNLYQLNDVPDYRTSYRGKLLKSKADGSGMEWVDMPTSAVWGNILGTLANQTDLANALAGKQPLIDASNRLAYSLISGAPSSLPASDVYPWAKAATKPSYTLDEVGDGTSRKLSDYITISDAASTYHPKEGTPSLSMTASALILRAVNNYYADIIIADASGSAGYLSIQARQEGVGWRNTILNPSGGNVGIGIKSPTELLHLGKLSAVQVATLYQNSNASFIVGLESGGNGIVWNRSNYYLRFGTNGTERMRIAADGNVGIGTTSPAYKLHVESSAGEALRLKTSTTYACVYMAATSGANWSVGCNSSNEFYFYNSAADASVMKIGSAGQITAKEITLKNGSHTVKIELDTNGNLKINGNVFATGAITAYQSN